MKKKSQEKKKVDHCRNINKNKASDMEKVKPEYTSEEIAYIYARYEQHAEAKRWFPEFFGDKFGEFIIVDKK
jgi:hypothetical protein